MTYTETLESIGDAIILWADPEGEFSGFTKVRTLYGDSYGHSDSHLAMAR